jgi:integrase
LGTRGKRKRLFFPTKKAAEKHLSETSVKVTRGEYLDRSRVPTFAAMAEEWVQSKSDRRPSYTETLHGRLNKYLLPQFGPIHLDQITVAGIEKLRDALHEQGRSPVTINGIIRMIGGIYKMAIRRGLCTLNPTDRVERAYAGDQELKATAAGEGEADQATPETVLAPEEISLLLTHAAPGLYRMLLTFLAATGLRSGEAFALRWADCQLGTREPKIYVRRSLSWARVKGEDIRPRFYPPKTKAGHRTVSIPTQLAALLKRWKLEAPPSDQDLVFPNLEGQPLRRSIALRRGLWPALRRAELRRVNMHSLRHSFASALIAKGSPVTEVQSILGHSSPAITLNVYSHWFRSTRTNAMDSVVHDILSAKSKKSGQKVGTLGKPVRPPKSTQLAPLAASPR